MLHIVLRQYTTCSQRMNRARILHKIRRAAEIKFKGRLDHGNVKTQEKGENRN